MLFRSAVTFDGNGGTPSEDSKAIQPGAQVGTLPTATRDGYTFNNWWTAKTGGTQISSTEVITDDRIFYAHWTANTYSVEFASTTACPLDTNTYAKINNQTFDSSVINKVNPTCTGYTFDGWTLTNGNTSTAKTGNTNNPTTDWVNKNKATYFKNLATTNNSTATMTANWKANEYTISFNSNKPSKSTANPTGSMNNQTYTYDTTTNLTSNGYSITGWTFTGWNTKADRKSVV